MSDFDTTLHRKIKNGLEFNVLFPVVGNSQTNLGVGDTHHSTKQMKAMVQKYYTQCNKVAPYLKKASLKETTQAVYDFLYNHIQYKQDNALQQLRTPANSWRNRVLGIDCKSYSIFASCILTSLNIKHYIRQIKQPNFKPHLYTHVYVVVPFNQQTGSLDDGSYVIDATVSNNREPIYIKKEDLFMSTQLPHVGLNGAKKKATRKPTKKKPVATKRKKAVARKKKIGLGTTVLGLGALAGIIALVK
ncbi:transglutaminase-like domain-containing protein [Flavobacterium sp.]|uniref:transglutaminase-like domain-containing protein n=1 Tax=Flavobacterium sp. TaxID=239 RepID=UPI00374CDEDC